MAQPDKRNLVIFLGAGFSAAFGIPVMRAFSDRIRDQRFLSASDQREFDNIQLTCDNMGALIGSSSRNLEQLSSFLAVQNINDPDFQYTGNNKYKTPAEALRLVKRCIYELVKPNLSAHEIKQHTPFFEDELHQKFNVSFVTTNYDLVLEISGVHRGRQVKPTAAVLEGNSEGRGQSIYAQNDAPPYIFKLHGSVNWFRKDGGKLFAFCTPPPRENIGLLLNEWLTQSPGHGFDCTDCVLVPPSVIKPQIDDVLGEQWRGATEAIEKADDVWFVGYSFPESDSFMRYFVASAFATNTRIRRLVVIDPDVAVKKRCLSIFRAERLKEVFAFLPMEWQSVLYKHLINGKIEDAAGGLNLERLDVVNRRRAMFWAD